MDNETNQRIPMLETYISDGTLPEIVNRYASLPELARNSDFGVLDEDIVVIDTETTGVSFNHDELTQIAAARMVKGEVVDWYVTFVNPGKNIPDDVAYLTHITNDDVKDAPTPAEALAGLVDFVGSSKLVAHNAEFDKHFTTRHPSGYPLLENDWIDSLDLARIVVPRMKSHRLIDLVTAFGAPLSTHRADADVEATCALLRILFAGIMVMPYSLVKTIGELAPKNEWPTGWVFSYLASLMKSENADDVAQDYFSLRELRRERLGSFENKASRSEMVEGSEQTEGEAVSFPTRQEISDAFSANGLVGELYSDYEPRQEQVEMAEEVCTAFSHSDNLVVEAGTGVGKSMAYLVPAALIAKKNGVKFGIATKTNALLDQLVYHELPLLQTKIDSLTYSALKGYTHYPCLRRVDKVLKDGAQMKDVAGKMRSQAPAIAALLSFIEQTDYDDIDNLKLEYRVLPRYSITSTSVDCLRRKCRYFGTQCFARGVRKRAESSDIVVTNHSLFFCNLKADGALMPKIDYWVIDEAHGAESEARRAFSTELSSDAILRLARKVRNSSTSSSVFTRIERNITEAVPDEASTLLDALVGKSLAAGAAFEEAAQVFAPKLKDLLYFDANSRSKGYENVEIWINDDIRATERFAGVVDTGRLLSGTAEKLVTASQELVGFLEDYESVADLQREVATIALELKELIKAVEIVLTNPSENYVYAASLCKKSDRLTDKLTASYLNVGTVLQESLYQTVNSVVFASATLAVGDTFDSFKMALGLGEGEESHCRECKLESSYDYDTNMTVYVVEDMPEPNEAAYLGALQDLLRRVHIAQNGSMLTLFTNRKEMEKCFEDVQPSLKEHDLRLVCQKWGVSVKGLRDDFLTDESLSLFALKSFWEGFDAPGSTLRGVIIPKLPFAKPTDPLSCERAERDDQAWRHYVLPSAIIETKQAAGRLIRKADDTGVLIFADHRLISKGYGKSFLKSMPSKNIKVMTVDEIVREIAASR